MSTALVTGCSSGIGFATALRLARDGLEVVATMRSPDRDGERLLDAASKAGLALRVLRLDVDEDASVAALFSEVGPLDVLVNNAGIAYYGSVEETPMVEWRRLVETNLLGAVRCMQAVLPGMRERRSGCIVNVSSVFGRVYYPVTAPYAATKAALYAVSEVAAMEGRPYGIRVVVVEPGATRTSLGDNMSAQPSNDSRYWATTRNTLAFLGAAFIDPSEPDVIADAISRALADPTTPLRVVAGHWSADTITLRERHSDEAWIEFVSSPTRSFAEQYRDRTGIDLFG